jgi:transposase InsO family protein
VLENALLRQQLILLNRQIERPQLTWRDRSIIVFLSSKLRGWKEALIIVKPDTVLRWHRDLFRRYWRRRSRSRSKYGRPPLTEDVVALIRRMAAVRAARENATWGAERIRGELGKLGVDVSKSPIQKHMEEVHKHRASKQTWATALRSHASDIWACDFLQTYDLFFRAVFVFVIIELGSRRIVHLGVSRNPTDAWTAQQLREATGLGEQPGFLIRDNVNKHGESFKRVASEMEVLRTPYRAPRANALCERFMGSLRRECLDHFIILNERHLHRIVKEYGTYFNNSRPHQGIDQRIPCQAGLPESPPTNGILASRPVLKELHHTYSWVVAQSVGDSQAQRPVYH